MEREELENGRRPAEMAEVVGSALWLPPASPGVGWLLSRLESAKRGVDSGEAGHWAVGYEVPNHTDRDDWLTGMVISE